MKKWIILIIVLLLVAASVLLFIALRKNRADVPRETVYLEMLVPWSNDSGLEHFQREARVFEEIYTYTDVTVTYMPLGDLNRSWESVWPGDSSPDLAVLSNIKSASAFLESDLNSPWTGSIWSLYLNVDTVKQAGFWETGVPDQWLNGSIDLEELETWMKDLSASGVVPISVGARFAWPLAAWIQHIALAESEGAATTFISDDGEPSSDTTSAVERWTRWVENGWVVEDWSEKDWPFSIQDLVGGKSALALLSSSLASSIPRNATDRISPIPFPSGKIFTWTVGSLWNIAVPASTENPEEARLLYEFFASEGVTQRLTEKLRTVFYSPEGRSKPGMLFTSVTNRTDSSFVSYLEEFVQSQKNSE